MQGAGSSHTAVFAETKQRLNLFFFPFLFKSSISGELYEGQLYTKTLKLKTVVSIVYNFVNYDKFKKKYLEQSNDTIFSLIRIQMRLFSKTDMK